MSNTTEATPAGYWRKADGSLIPESMVKPIEKTRHNLVIELATKARELSALMGHFKASAFGDISAFVQLSAEQYGAKLGGNKGNVTLHSFDGQFKVVRQMQETISFDERLQAAKSLIDECLNEWTQGSRDEIKALINDAFQVNQAGQINTGRVLGLKRLEIKNEKWQRAMQAIADSVQVCGSKPYFRVYERVGDSDEYQPISLDIASL